MALYNFTLTLSGVTVHTESDLLSDPAPRLAADAVNGLADYPVSPTKSPPVSRLSRQGKLSPVVDKRIEAAGRGGYSSLR